MGLIRKSSITEYWHTTHESQTTPWFRTCLPEMFQLILKFFHVTDTRDIARPNAPGYNPSARFESLIDHCNKSSKYYVPNQNLTVDESMVGTRGRTSMLQYIPSKHTRFGVKLWVLVEAASSYILRTICYRGGAYDPTHRDSCRANVVMSLLRGSNLLNHGYHVVCDSFFTSLRLAADLLQHRTYITGTVRSNRPMPPALKHPDLAVCGSIFMKGSSLWCWLTRATRDINLWRS